MDTAPMHLDQIVEEMKRRTRPDRTWRGCIRAIRRSMALWPSRCAGSMRWASTYEVVPGVPAFAGAAAKLKTELTLPEIAQTVIVTRTGMKASSMPEGEQLEVLGPIRRDAGDPPVDPQSRLCPPGAGTLLRRRLPGGDRLPRDMAGRTLHPHHAGRRCATRCARRRSPARR
jgi:hypothetical protein